MSTLSKIPFTLLIIIYMVVAHYAGFDMSGVAGYIFLGLGVFVMAAEFFKSGDISVAAFAIDIVSAVLAVIVATVLMCYLYWSNDPEPGFGQITFFHWFGCAIIMGDAILSPFNGFRTALRNFGVGGGV
jgi:hypothetical protein